MEVNNNEPVQSAGPPLRVLLVDDDATMHEMLELCLDKAEYSLSSATNAVEAVKVMAHDPPDIVITDAMMPGTSGFSLINTMKASPMTVDIPIILWTVMEDMNGGVMDSSGKADITMSKPFNLPNILHSLSSAKDLIKPAIDVQFW